jgi:hypothetical protein
MPEEQLYLALYITLMKFQMEISKLLIVTCLSDTAHPRTVVIQHVTKGCSQSPAVLCNIFCQMNSFYSSHNIFAWSVHLSEHIIIKQIYALEAGMKVLF